MENLERELTDFINWLGENRPYHKGTLYCDMKDYIARKESTETEPFEIREIDGKKYKVSKIPCTCQCHSNPHMMHIRACCDNGFKELLFEVDS